MNSHDDVDADAMIAAAVVAFVSGFAAVAVVSLSAHGFDVHQPMLNVAETVVAAQFVVTVVGDVVVEVVAVANVAAVAVVRDVIAFAVVVAGY